MIEIPKEEMRSIEKAIEVSIIQEDTETIYSLLKTEKDPIFVTGMIPYYALFIQSCQEYMGQTFVEEKIKDIRNFIKAYGEGFGKSKKRIDSIDANQNEQFKAQLRFDFMKEWDIHYNLGTYWTSERHIIGNTQMLADFLGVKDVFGPKTGKVQFKLGKQVGSIVASIREGFSQVSQAPMINRNQIGGRIEWFYDLNTNASNSLFSDDSTKTLNLFFLNLTCNMNFVKYILRPLFDEDNKWIFRIEYVVTYYSYRAIQKLKNYCENNTDLQVDLKEFEETFKLANNLFNSKFRNCMMHYGLANQDLIQIENIEKPFYGIVETCFDGLDYCTLLSKIRTFTDGMVFLCEKKLNAEGIILKRL